MKEKVLLGEILIENGLITKEQLEKALLIQKRTKEFLGAVLIREGYIRETDLLRALSRQFNIPLVDIENIRVDWELAAKFSKTLIVEHRCIPVSSADDVITVAINNPLDAWAVSEIEKNVPGRRIKTILVKSADMDRMLDYYRNILRTKLKKLF